MSDEYYIDLNLTDAPPTKYKYAVGDTAIKNQETKSDRSYLKALTDITLPKKVGVAASVGVEKLLRAYDKNDGLESVDPKFNAFEVWRQNNHAPEDFDQIQDMTNFDQYYLWRSVYDYENEAAQAVSDAGLVGQGGAFVAQVMTDPTTYFGFGAAKMLSKGMGATKAYAASAVGAVAVSESIEQSADVTDTRSMQESATTIAAAGVVGGLLGKGVDVWGSLRAKKLASKDMDFHQFSRKTIEDADTLYPRAQSLSAAMLEKNPEDSLIFGKAARSAAWATRYLSPKQWMQTSFDDTTRVIGDEFFGRNLMTVGDVAGKARTESFIELADLERSLSNAKIQKVDREIREFIASGNIVDEDVMTEAAIRASRMDDPLTDNTPSGFVAQKNREFFGAWKDKLKDNPDFNERADFGVPMIFRPDKLAKNFDGLVLKLERGFARAKAGLQQDLADVKSKLKAMETASAKSTGEKLNKIKGRQDRLLEEQRLIEDFIKMSDDDIVTQARLYATKMITGQVGKSDLASPFFGKTIPNRFKERVFNIEEYAEFIETNPVKLMKIYSDEVAPYHASFQKFGESTPKGFVNNYEESMLEKIAAARSSGDEKLAAKLTVEHQKAVQRLEKGFDHVTGQHIAKFSDLAGSDMLNVITAARNYIAATKLAARVLSQINELGAIVMTRHFTGLKRFTQVLGKMATSPELRAMSRRDAESMSYAINTALHSTLGDELVDSLAITEARGGGKLANAARKSQWLNNKMQYYSGGIAADHITRKTISLAQQGLIKNSLQDLVDGTINEARKRDLAFLGISTKAQAKTMLKYANKYGETVDGIFRFATEKWDDADAKRTMELLLMRDNRRVSLNPSTGDVPHAFHVPAFNMLTQFKSWSVTAGQVYGLSALQRADAKSMMSLASFVGISAMSYMLAEVARGNKPPTNVDEIIYSGITNSGLFGVSPDYGGHWLASTLFDLEAGGAKFAEINRPIDTIAGPLGSTVSDVFGVAKPAFQAIDPNKEAEFDDTWGKNLMDVLPIPLVKPLIKNELLSE